MSTKLSNLWDALEAKGYFVTAVFFEEKLNIRLAQDSHPPEATIEVNPAGRFQLINRGLKRTDVNIIRAQISLLEA